MTSLPTFLHSVCRYFGSSYFQRCTVDHVDCKALQTLLQSMGKTRDPGGFYLHQNFWYKATTYPAHMHRTSRHFQRSPFKCAHITEHRSRSPLLSRYLACLFPYPVFVPQGARVPYQLLSKQTAAGSVRLLGICLRDRERREREMEVGGEQKTRTRSEGGEVRRTKRNLKWGCNRDGDW